MNDHKGQVRVSSEKQFVYHDSINRGHVQLPRMVIACQNLSATAKIVYGVISGYVFEHGRSAFPSTSSIAMYANITKKTAIKYIDELVAKGFILKERNGNRRTNNYYLVDADKIAHLQVSEMFHRAVKTVLKDIEICLYDEVYNSFEAIQAKIDDMEFREIPVNSETEQALIEALVRSVKKEGESMFNPPNRNKAKPDVPAAPEPIPVADTALDGTPKKAGNILGGTSRFGLPDDVTKWKNDNFVQYFYEKYIDATGHTHEAARSKHRGMIGRTVKHTGNDKNQAKLLIDKFFEMGYENQTLEWFSTSGRLSEVELFIEKGKKPFYLTAQEKKAQVESAVQENKGMSAEDFLNRIKQTK